MTKLFKIKAYSVGLLSLLLSQPVIAVDPTSGVDADGAPSGNMQQLPEYLLNLGSYLGYNLNNSSTTTTQTNTLIDDVTNLQQRLQQSVSLYLGAININHIVDPGAAVASSMNTLVNSLLRNNEQSGGGATGQSNGPYLLTNPLIDQQPYQNNPINQSILNTLTTPDGTYCLEAVIAGLCNSYNSEQGGLSSKCCPPKKGLYFYQGAIGTNVIGTIPSPKELYSYKPLYSDLLDQLNGNTLIDPLLYSTSNTNNNNSASSTTTPVTSGMHADTQAQSAENYIRYVSGSVSPSAQTTFEVYNQYYNLAVPTNTGKSTPPANLSAQKTLSNYIAGLRTFAAQTSVGVGNLYYMFSRRMLNNTGSATNSATSPALDEYNMATRRLYNPANASGSGCQQSSSSSSSTPSSAPAQGCQWVDQINQASPATVEKEIAILLSEINYQLYLTRQQQERLLLTNTIMLFQLGHLVEPSPLQAPQQ